jgi:hypothetical protein
MLFHMGFRSMQPSSRSSQLFSVLLRRFRWFTSLAAETVSAEKTSLLMATFNVRQDMLVCVDFSGRELLCGFLEWVLHGNK